MSTDPTEQKLTVFPPLTHQQRRVLGVLIEKAFTTPEYYPLTLKAVTTGCNQKSNRDPVVNFNEETVLDTLDELRKLGLAACVHTDGGRAERYRHYMRHKFDLTEGQLAIMGELMLRGRQQLGELRSRASRMAPIESLEELRDALEGLKPMRGIQASGDLARRGIEVDHALYSPQENAPAFAEMQTDETVAAAQEATANAPVLESSSLEECKQEVRELREELEQVRAEMETLRRAFEDLRTQLGG